MYEVCHRCQAELPAPLPRAEALLFCPHCSAPQLLLPEHMRAEVESEPVGGVAPPPLVSRPGIEWRAVLPTAAWVAAVGGLMSMVGLKSGFIDALSPLWVMASGSIVLALYLRRRPKAWMNGRAGWRVGLVTGLLLVGAKGVGLSATGMVARFATHSMAGYDAQSAKDGQSGQALAQGFLGMPARQDDKAFMDMYRALLESPEVRAGSALGVAGLQALFVVLFAGLGGLASGAVERRRRLVAGQG